VSATSIGDDYLSLSWTNPTDADLAGVIVRRLQGATAPTLTSGTMISDFTDQADYVVDPGLTPGTQYSYAFFAYDKAKNYSAASIVTGRTTGAARPTPTSSKG
jgi:chitodextrinase